jgi:cytochrome c556
MCAASALVALGAGCGDREPAPFELPVAPPRPLRAAMYDIDRAFRSLQATFSSAALAHSIAEDGGELARLAEHEAFVGWTARPEFQADRALFEDYRADLRDGARSVEAGAAAADMEQVRDGFIRVKQSCVACHKRFQPSY